MGRAEHGLIQAYLVELRLSVADLPDAEEIVAEAEDHLLEAATRHGEQEALARFGTPSLVSATFIKEARKGAAVATTFTKRAGLAAAASPLFLVLGALANEATGRGAAHGLAVFFEALAAPAVVWGLLGLSARHGGFGLPGRLALFCIFVSLLVSLAMPWSGIVVGVVLWGVAFALVGVLMLRAAVLPRLAVVLMGFSGAAWVPVAIAITATGGDAGGTISLAPLVGTFGGFSWLGWAMWREEPLPTPGPPPWATASA
jgi:hypothetical protein